MTQEAFNQIAEGLTEAIRIARESDLERGPGLEGSLSVRTQPGTRSPR